jgi:nitroimidazol reductase NimA-like FMN-containing flavoprotein (pyridoxamine 5'-phosphate oxidase superfamily)
MAEDPVDAVVVTDRTRVRRHRDRAAFDREVVHGILDEGFICHLACHVDGTTWMIPTAYGRRGEELLLHGALGNHIMSAAGSGVPLTATVTLVDGMVLARSTFNHSINYRSVVVFGQARHITDPDDKAAALARIVEHMLPGRSAEARPPTPSELRQTQVLALPITEASAKVRTGPPGDGDSEDAALAVWAGVVPLRSVAGAPEAAPGLCAPAAAVGPSASWLDQQRWAAPSG